MDETKRFETVKPFVTLSNGWITGDEIKIAQPFHGYCGDPSERALGLSGDGINDFAKQLKRLRVVTQVTLIWFSNRGYGGACPERYSVGWACVDYYFGRSREMDLRHLA